MTIIVVPRILLDVRPDGRNYPGILAPIALIASGVAAVLIPGLGLALLVATVATSGVGVFVAWRRGLRPRRWILPSLCLGLSVAFLGMLVAAPLAVESEVHSVATDGRTRQYRLYRPPGVPSGARLPVLIVLHGLMQRAHTIENITGLDRIADAEGFLAVYPEGFRRSWNDTDRTKPATRAGIDDIGFIRDLIDDVVEWHHGDRARVYVTGFSNGGFLALRLACGLSETIAAVAVVGSGTNANFPPGCAMERPVPALFVLGRDDPLTPWGSFGGSGERWAARLGCEGTAKEAILPDTAEDGTRVLVSRYERCPGEARVRQLTVEGGGHTWPGGTQYLPELLVGATSRDMDAGEEIWKFVKVFSTRDGH